MSRKWGAQPNQTTTMCCLLRLVVGEP